jgi:hypothetical protein
VRGSPLFRALVAFAVLLALGVPLWQLTHPRETSGLPEVTLNAPPEKEVSMQLDFTLLPRTVAVLYLGKELWSSQTPQPELRGVLRIPWPAEGVDLRFQIDWPDQAPLAAARVRVTAPDGTAHERTLWSKGPADEVLSFP